MNNRTPPSPVQLTFALGSALAAAFALVSLTACTCGGEATAPIVARERSADPKLEATGAGPVWQLFLKEGRYTLPSLALPPGLDPAQSFVVQVEEDDSKAGKRKKRSRVFKGVLPFSITGETRGFAPTGVVVTVDGQRVAFSESDAVSSFGKTWRIKDGKLVISNPGPPAEVRISYSGVENAVKRHNFDEAQMKPIDFTRTSLTLADHTRDGMLLPAPGIAEWDIEIPDNGAMFEAWVALEPSPMFGFESDGAAVKLVVVADGVETVVDRYPLAAVGADFKNWRANLDSFKGKKVVVRLVTETAADPASAATANANFDWVFLGSPTIWGHPKGEPRHVIVIGMDTTRPDHWGVYGYDRATTPNLDRLLGESAIFTRAWAPAPRTRPSFRTATTGQYPLQAVGAKNIGAVFQEQGFATAGFVANVHLVPRFDFDDGFDTWVFDGTAKADQQVDRALEWLDHHQDRDTYMFLHVMDPHIPYNAPGEFHDKFVEDPDPDLPKKFNRWQAIDWNKDGNLPDQRKAHIEGLYDGEMAFMDQQLGRLMAQVDAMPGRKLMVIHSDHGEEFWEHGTFEHNHTLYDEVTRVVLAVRPGVGLPEGQKLDTPVTLADIAPTIYDYVAFPQSALPEALDGFSLRPLIDGKPAADFANRPIGVAHLRYSFERWGVVTNDHKYILWSGTGQEELYDLKTDPGEKQNLAATADLTAYRTALGVAHEMPVGPGWRVKVSVVRVDKDPYVIQLPAKAVFADVLEPERTIAVRANEEWGEKPKKTKEDIGTVTLAPDGMSLSWAPGTKPTGGVLFVRFEAEADPKGAKIQRGGQDLPMGPTSDGAWGWTSSAMSITLVPGTVFDPPPDEADVMAAAAADDLALLEALGYLAPSDDGHGHGPPPEPPPTNPDGSPADPAQGPDHD